MERLTIRTPKGAAVKMGEPASKQEAREQLMRKFSDVCEKLARYEDLEEKCIEENSFSLRALLEKWNAFCDDIAQWLEWRNLKESGRLAVLPEGFDRERVADIILEQYCPSYFGIKDLETCLEFSEEGRQKCKECWEAALKGGK